MTTVPRTPAMALGVRIRISSPGRIFSRATASANLPDSRSIVDFPGTSVIVRTERSRTVTTALPPRSMRASDWSPVVTVSWRKTSSLNFSGMGVVSATRRAVTFPSRVVTIPALDWARTADGARSTADNSTARPRSTMLVARDDHLAVRPVDDDVRGVAAVGEVHGGAPAVLEGVRHAHVGRVAGVGEEEVDPVDVGAAGGEAQVVGEVDRRGAVREVDEAAADPDHRAA